MTASRNHVCSSIVAMGLAAVLAVPAAAQGAGGNDSDYSKEVQACLSQGSQLARETCREEARKAQAAQGRGELSKGNGYVVARAQCRPLSGEFRAACETQIPPGADRVRIEPRTSNSVVVLVPSSTR